MYNLCNSFYPHVSVYLPESLYNVLQTVGEKREFVFSKCFVILW